MALIFGSTEALEILRKNREIQQRLATAQEDYNRWIDRLEEVEENIEELEREQNELERKINELLKLAKEHGVEIVGE